MNPAGMHEHHARTEAPRETHFMGDQKHRHAGARHILEHFDNLSGEFRIEC